jgi:hypothetical protein
MRGTALAFSTAGGVLGILFGLLAMAVGDLADEDTVIVFGISAIICWTL